MDNLNLKKYFLWTLIVAFSISAVIGIFIFIFGDFGEIEVKLLLTTLAIGGYSLTGLSCSVIYIRNHLKIFSIIGIMTSIFACLITIITTWEIIDIDDIWKTMIIFIILSVTMAHISLLFQIRPKMNNIKYLLIATIIFISIVAIMLIKLTIFEFEEDEYFRTLGVFSILAILGTIATPIMNRINRS